MPDSATTHLANFLREKYPKHYFNYTDLALPISYQDAAAILRVAGFDELRYSLEVANQRAFEEAARANNLQLKLDTALSVDGVTADDAPKGINGDCTPVSAWLEGYQEGQSSVLDILDDDE